jgi:predicted pyridoxine 5'-phosphate oxidase superfamily flavin-nucleotide-binding protein
MSVKLTDRMKNWIEACGCHICVCTPEGVPNVIMARYATTGDDIVCFALTQDEAGAIKTELMDNPWIAFGVSQVGGIRAAYQFKGKGKMMTSGSIYDGMAEEANEILGGRMHAVLEVRLTEVYCTKPGHVAGTRMDTSKGGMEKFEEELGWRDFAPPRRT